MKLQHPGFTDDRHGISSTSLAKMHWTALFLLLVFSTKYCVFPKPHSVSINMRSKSKRLSALNLDWMSLCVWVGDCVKILQTRSASFSTQLPIYASVVDDSQHLEQTPVSAVACCRWVRPQPLAANCSLSTLQASEKAIKNPSWWWQLPEKPRGKEDPQRSSAKIPWRRKLRKPLGNLRWILQRTSPHSASQRFGHGTEFIPQ